jgi:speckle-type POZ protein
MEVYLYKKKVGNDNFNINFSLTLGGRDEFQWEKKAFDLDTATGSYGWPKLMSIDVLFDESKGYIDASGRLKIHLEIKLTELDANASQLDGSTVSQGYQCETCSHYFENPAYSDFTLICDDGVSLPVHRLILAKKSPVFKTLFDGEMNESKRVLKDISSETMKDVMRFIYRGTVEMEDVKSITNVLHAAATYEIAELIALCIDALMEKIDKENVMAILNIAYVYGHVELENKCLVVILK